MTDAEIAAQLGITGEFTPEALFRHAFPGVADCLPAAQASRLRDGFGRMLLDAAHDDTVAEGMPRYHGMVESVRGMLDTPDMRAALRDCGPRANPTPATPPATPRRGWGRALAVTALATALLAVVGGVSWRRRRADS